ncbi:MAG: hypothetical protein ACLQT5_01195 [Steroidobacteraceae bacterium]
MRSIDDDSYDCNYYGGDHIGDHYSDEEFFDRLEAANSASFLADNDAEFLADIESKHDQYGDRMFFSDAQARYLNMLSVRGGYGHEEEEDFEDCEVIPAAALRSKKKRSGA